MSLKKKRSNRLNLEIKSDTVRLVNCEYSGIYDTKYAFSLAFNAGLDLIEINPNTTPPICTIEEYSKFLYKKEKKEKELKKKQIVVETKEIRIGPNIAENDMLTKEKQALKFLKAGDKVLLSMFFKGREICLLKQGQEKMDTFIEDLGEDCKIDKAPKLDGKKLTAVLSLKKN